MGLADRNRFKLFEFISGVVFLTSGISTLLSRRLHFRGWYAHELVAVIVALFLIVFGVVMIRVGLPRVKGKSLGALKRK